MHASLRTNVDKLSPEQTALLDQYRKRWAEIRLSTARADRTVAEAGVQLAYKAAGYSSPRQIVWCDGPLEIAELWGCASPSDNVGANLKVQIIERVRRRVATDICRSVSAEVLITVAQAIGSQSSDSLSAAVVEAVLRSAEEVRPPILTRIQQLFSWSSSLRNAAGFWLSFRDASFNQHELSWLGTYQYFRDVCGFWGETEPLGGLWLVAGNSGWVLPHENVCWIAERHNILQSDARGRLHCATGPALQYRDGWSAYAWKGIEVPGRLIERPERITMAEIDCEPDIHLRRCMIERVTPERYVTMGGAFPVSEDEAGVLWLKRWWNGDAWAAVEVTNGTAEPDGTRKHYFLQVPPELRSARAAVAWTYGMTERQYARLVHRT